MMKNFTEFLNEKLDVKLSDNNKDMKNDLLSYIQKTVNSDDIALIINFIDSYIKKPEDSNIDGLINDSDIYDFYLKNQSNIDKLLLGIKWYDNAPADKNVFSVYDYIIISTKTAISEIMVDLKKDLESK